MDLKRYMKKYMYLYILHAIQQILLDLYMLHVSVVHSVSALRLEDIPKGS